MIDWEQNTTSPNAVFLSAIASAGADVMYILTGQRPNNQLPPREAALLDNYRHCDDEAKRVIEGVADLASQPKLLKKKA